MAARQGRERCARRTDHASIERAIAAPSRTRSARIDVLINNAGVAVSKGVLEQTEADWDKVIDTNLKGAFFVAQTVAKRMVARDPKPHWGGNIVNIASVAGARRDRPPRAVCRLQGRSLAA